MADDDDDDKSIKSVLEDAWEEAPDDEGAFEHLDDNIFDDPEDKEDGETPTETARSEKDAESEGIRSDTSQEGEAQSLPDDGGGAETSQPLAGDVKAPASWTPTAREHWEQLPPEVQEQVRKRELDFNSRIQESAEAVKGYQDFRQATDPYSQFFAAEGISASQAAASLMQTAAGLRVGTSQQKAAIVREIIGNFDIDIGVLDTMLSGQAVASTGEDTHLQGMLQQQLAPIHQFMGQVQQQQQISQANTQYEVQGELDNFAATHEYFEDLRMPMADVREYYAHHYNRTLTLDEAYQVAAQGHPEIGPILAQRQAAGSAPNLQSKKNAGSSIHGTPERKAAVNTDDMSIEDALRAAWAGDL